MRGMLALAMGNWEQTELFPRATLVELKAAKSILMRYRWMRGIVDTFTDKEIDTLTPKQLEALSKYKPLVDGIEKAVGLIQEPDVKRMIERRFIKGERWKETVVYFSNYHESTVDRKINKGIESVAETLKLWDW
jgi:hypothetical protein